MQRITQFWKSGIKGKLAIGCSGLLVFVCLCELLWLVLPDDSTQETGEEPTPTQAFAEAKPTSTQRATGTPRQTDTLPPTDTLQPTATPTPTDTPEPTATLTPRRQLEVDISSALGSPREDYPRLTACELDDQSGHITVRWSIQSRMGSGVEQDWAFGDAVKILLAIAKSGIDYSEIEMIGTANLVDNYGNTQTTEVVRLRFSRSSLANVNWEHWDKVWNPPPLYLWADYKEAHPRFQWWSDN